VFEVGAMGFIQSGLIVEAVVQNRIQICIRLPPNEKNSALMKKNSVIFFLSSGHVTESPRKIAAFPPSLIVKYE
jgi:hypothetical protein